MRYREQSSTLIKCQTGLLEKQPWSIMSGWQESSTKWCTSHWDTGRVSRCAVAKAEVMKRVRGRALAVMRLMIRLESLLPWCICKAFHFPAGTSEASGKCWTAVEAKRQESADLHLPCLFLIQLYLWDAAVSGSPAERQHGCRHVRQYLIPHWPPWLNVSSQSSRSVLQEKVGESYVLNQ